MGLIEIIVLGIALSADAFAVTISNTFVYASERKRRLFLMPVMFGLFQGIMPLTGYFLGGLAAEVIEQYSGIVTLVILGFIGGNMVREGAMALLDKRNGDELEDEFCDEFGSEMADDSDLSCDNVIDFGAAAGISPANLISNQESASSFGAESSSSFDSESTSDFDFAPNSQTTSSKHLTVTEVFVQAIATAIDAFAVGVSLRAENVEIVMAASIIACTTFLCCCIALFIGRKLGRLLGDRAQVVGGLVLVGIGIKAFFA